MYKITVFSNIVSDYFPWKFDLSFKIHASLVFFIILFRFVFKYPKKDMLDNR